MEIEEGSILITDILRTMSIKAILRHRTLEDEKGELENN